MRIIAGEARGRRLARLPGAHVRPTGDRVREALFSMLDARLERGFQDLRVLDLFAGSGALGLEAISRGALRATLVESDAGARTTVVENARLCGFESRAEVVAADAMSYLRAGPPAAAFDLVLADPPYRSDLLPLLLAAVGAPAPGGEGAWLSPAAWVALEHPGESPPPERVGALHRHLVRRYGRAGISLFAAAARIDRAS